MMTSEEIVIYGGGGFGREVAWLAGSCEPAHRVVAFVDDNDTVHGSTLNNIPVMSLNDAWKRFPHAKMVGGVGTPLVRRQLMEKAASLGFDFATLIHPRVERSIWLEIGAGTVICAGNILTVNIILGHHVQINLDCTIGHDVRIDDYVTLAPGVHVSGHVLIGMNVYIGTGAVILNGTLSNPVVIGDDAVIGAGACVTKSVPPSLTVVGVPAKPLLRSK